METLKVNYLEDSLQDQATVFLPGDGEILSAMGSKITIKVTSPLTNGQFGLYEILLAPGTIGAKLHYHRFMDETFMVNKGVLTVQLGQREIHAPAGSVVYIPRFTPHGFANNTDEEVVCSLLFNPGQNREGFFRGLMDILSEQPIDPKKYLQLYNKYDTFPVDVTNMLPVKSSAS